MAGTSDPWAAAFVACRCLRVTGNERLTCKDCGQYELSMLGGR